MKHIIKINEKTLLSKPKGNEAGYISNNLDVRKEVTIKEFSELVTQPYAYTWTPFYFEGKRNKENWQSSSIFYLDFDNGTKLNDIKNRLDMLSLRPNVIYNTLSDTIKKRKFRVVFFIDGIVKCSKTAEWIQSNLVKMFEDSDQSCNTIERMVFPGFSIYHLDERENSGIDVMRILNSYVISRDKVKDNFNTRNMKKVEGIYDDVKDEMEYIIHFNQSKKPIVDIYKIPDIIPHFKWDKAFKEIKILSAFDSGVRLKHMEIFGLATNLQYIKGGLLYMKKKMEEVNNNKNRIDINGNPAIEYISQQFATLSQVKKKKYLPQMLNKFSPFEEDHELTNILESVRWKRGRIDIIEKYETITLNDAEKKLHDEFYKKVKKININDDIFDITNNPFDIDLNPNYIKKIIVFKVPTGIGKTRELENLKNTLIATKTNNLKKELSDRMIKAGNQHAMTPDYPTFSNDDINEMISSFTNSNLYDETSKIITKIVEGRKIKIRKDKVYIPTQEDILIADAYKSDNELCRNTTGTVITTHARAILDNSFKHDTIIFDECPLDTLIQMGTYVFNFAIFDGTDFTDDIKPIEDWVRTDLGFNQIIDTPEFTISNYSKFCEYCALNGESNLIRLLDSDYVYRDNRSKSTRGEVTFATKKEIPNKNIIIMSATAPVEIYRYVFGDRIEVIDISNVEKKGKIKQYTNKSWSRSSFIKASENSLKELKDRIGDKEVITFMNFKKIFSNPSLLHFGNTSGYDTLRGRDIAVVGTDNKPIHVYFFYAKIIGLNLKGSDNMLDTRIIEWGGFRFKTMTFENEVLRNIQLSIIESELIQAVGRNRTLREECETLLFSNQPLSISDEFIDK